VFSLCIGIFPLISVLGTTFSLEGRQDRALSTLKDTLRSLKSGRETQK